MNDSSVNWQSTPSATPPPQPPPDLMKLGESKSGCVPLVVVVCGILVLLPMFAAVAGFSVRLFHITCGC
jgi:hypothetical protein